MARPTDYTADTALLICTLIAEGHPLTKICAIDSMPGISTVYRWLHENEQFQDRYRQAREDQADTVFDQTLDIADAEPQLDDVSKDGEGAMLQVNGPFEQWRKTRIDTRKWMAARLRPKKYGELIKQEVSGPDGKPLPLAQPVLNVTIKAIK